MAGILNPTTPLTKSITDLSKHVFCPPACNYYRSTSTDISFENKYDNFPQCQELFLKDKNIDQYCNSKEHSNWLIHLKATAVTALAYLILLFLLNQMKRFKAWRLGKRTWNKEKMGNQEPLMSTYDNSLSLIDTTQKLAPERTILQDFNIKIRKEEILCILGDNGPGGFTLARILAGLSSPVNGSIIYNDREYQQAELDSMIGYCSQKDVPLLDNTIDENLKFFAQLKGKSQDLNEIKNQVGLTKHEGPLLISQLSADQKIMLNTAIVLLSDPQIIIMDDPTAELDSSTKVTFKKLLEHLKTLKEKKTIIYTAHSVKDAELADRVAILEKGGNLSGTLSQIKEKKLRGQYIFIISIRGEETVQFKTKQNVQKLLEKDLKNPVLLDGTIDSILKYKISLFENKDKLCKLFPKLANISNIEINFKRLNLDEYFEKLQDPTTSSQPEKIKIISASTGSSVKTQIWAIFSKRIYTWAHRKTLILLFIFFDSFLFSSFPIGKYYLEDYYLLYFYVLRQPLLFSVTICGFIKMIFTGSELIVNRESNQIHTLNIMGLNPWGFWIGNLLADFLSRLPLIIISSVLIQDIETHDLSERILLTISTITLHINIIVLIYGLSINKWVKNLPSFLLITLFVFLMSYFTPIILYYFKIKQNLLSLLLSTVLELIIGSLTILYSVPLQTFMGMHIIRGIIARIFDKVETPSKNSWPESEQIIVLVMTWLSIFMTLLCIALKTSADFKKSQIKNKSIPEPIKPTNPKVIDEQNRVKSLENTDFLKFADVHKKEALFSDSKVLDLTFGIPEGSILALVGNNRGGKSEALDIYGRETFVSSGKILLQGEKLPCPPYNSSTVKIGFCLSTNVFWEDITVFEHIKIYAMIKGISSLTIKEAVWGIMNALDLVQYAEIRIKEIKEEAVKRKLSVGLAVLGAPGLVLLDEPTKGLDPAGRNQVWKILKELVSKNSTILMATNQMEDAELKADRTGIMIDGFLESIDPVDRIKRDKTDFYLKIEGIKKGENENLKKRILSHDKQFEIFQESAQERKLTFIVPKQKAKSNFGKVFEVIAEDLGKGEIRDFSFSEKSLSEVFEDLAKSAKHKKRESVSL